MKSVPSVIILALFLAGCGTPQPASTRPGATLEGSDLPPVLRGNIAITDSPPVPIRMQNPFYPQELSKKGITGEVLVEFIVNSSGRVVNARAVSSPNPAMAAAAVDAVMRSEFRPGIRAGKPTATKLRVPIVFDLQAEKPKPAPASSTGSPPAPTAVPPSAGHEP